MSDEFNAAANNAADGGERVVSLETSAEWLPYAIRDTVQQKLEALGFGFQVSYFDDQRDGSSVTVRW